MNIADKRRFHAEALRVLRAGGHFALSEVTLGKGGLPFYPTPWSEDGTTSHLRTEEETLAGLQGAGFHVLSVLDRSEATIVFLRRMRERIARDGPPRIGTHILMGPGAREKARNSARNVEEGRIKPIEVLCRKPD